nr:pyrophosphate-energized vacuolar membrane proton pump-like [Ipomoea batatas]
MASTLMKEAPPHSPRPSQEKKPQVSTSPSHGVAPAANRGYFSNINCGICCVAGATSFLFTEYQYVGIFMVAFAILIFVFLGPVEGFSTNSQPCTYDETKLCKPALATAVFSTISFLLGALTSVVSGFLGMKIATYATARTTLEARKDVGADLVGKVERNILEDDPRCWWHLLKFEVNACNGFYCDWFSPNKAYKPKMWTEAWTAWFTEFGGPVPYRPAEDLAYSVAKFIMKDGSFINYYMDIDRTLANLTLADLDDGDGLQRLECVQMDNKVVEHEFLVVGRRVTDKPTKFLFFRDIMVLARVVTLLVARFIIAGFSAEGSEDGSSWFETWELISAVII